MLLQMKYGLQQTAPPEVEPVEASEVADYLRVSCDSAPELNEITRLIRAAREYAETYTSRQFVEATWQMTLSGFPYGVDGVQLPRPPLIEVVSVKYVDTEGNEQTLDESEYQVDVTGIVGVVVPAYGKAWPNTRKQLQAVTVEYKAGFSDDPEQVPESIRQAIKLLASHWYTNREPVVIGTITANVPLTVNSLLDTQRVMEAV